MGTWLVKIEHLSLFQLSVGCVSYRTELVVAGAGPAGSFSLMYLVI
jgi:hypothetical protein